MWFFFCGVDTQAGDYIWLFLTGTGLVTILKIAKPTPVIPGTNDGIMTPANSLNMAVRIKAAVIVQIKDAGHAVADQCPYKDGKLEQTFPTTIK